MSAYKPDRSLLSQPGGDEQSGESKMAKETSQRKGYVLAFYRGSSDGDVSLTDTARKFQEEKSLNLIDLINRSGLAHETKKMRSFCLPNVEFEFALVNIGKKGAGINLLEDWDEGKENIRTGVASGVKELNESGVKIIYVDPCGDAEAAAEGAYLCTYFYDELKSADKKKPPPELILAPNNNPQQAAWDRGITLAGTQNFARYLMESPANEMTPTIFARKAEEKLGSLPNVTVIPRDKEWAKSKNMGAFLSVTQGSHQHPVFLEVSYKGSNDPPVVLAGKGITFDSGGTSIKGSAKMDEMRADMGGAACALSAILAAAKLKLPVNIIGLMPLTENMPGGGATKPGDVHRAMNGKSIQIDDTDAEGRLVLSDALCYAETFKPCAIIDLATLTGAMCIALGEGATGVFTNSESLWQQMHQAGVKSGDRVWRFPLFKLYSQQMTDCLLADVNNITADRIAGACTAAGFLKEFVTSDHWMHMDIAGVMYNATQVPYLPKGMTGRPTRTLIEFLTKFKKP